MPKRQQQAYYEVCGEQEAKYINSDNNNKHSHNGHKRNDHLAVAERDPKASAAFNYEYRVDSVTWKNALATGVRLETTDHDHVYGTPIIEHTYENLKFELKLSKKLLLQKFFRHNEKNYAIYENLCRGCGYGVFEARGELCNFCQCLVDGVKARQAAEANKEISDRNGDGDIGVQSEYPADTNIYENICDKCGAVYSSETCVCETRESPSACESPSEDKASVKTASDSVKSEKSHVKLSSKSFTKRDKRSIFHGFIGSLKRVKQAASSATAEPATRHLEIVHNVDGYENVFRTQETFDLQRICELKRTQTSNSDQHIYGRLQVATQTLPIQQSQSHDELLQVSAGSVDGLSTWLGSEKLAKKRDKAGSKRPRISKPRLLRSSSSVRVQSPAASVTSKESIYLPSSVCSWMSALRHEVHNYHSFGLPIDDTNLGLCTPKSIPAKSTYAFFGNSSGVSTATRLSLLAPAVTNSQNIGKSAAKAHKSVNQQLPAATTSRISDVSSSSSNDSGNCEELVTLRRPASAASQHSAGRKSPASQMVYDFKQSLLAKQMQPQEEPNPPAARAAQQRAKRQAIYLKIDNNNSNTVKSNTTSNSDDPTTTPAFDRQFVEAAANSPRSAGTAQDLASRRQARQAFTTTQKRCGIYERDSEFVNDILGAFEIFLQRDSADAPNESQNQAAANTTSTEVISAACQRDEPEHITVAAHDQQVIAIAVDPRALEVASAKQQLIAACKPELLHSAAPVGLASGPNRALNVLQLITNQLLATSLNNAVICYDQSLSAFRHYIDRHAKYASFPSERLVRKYRRICAALTLVQGVNSVKPHESVLQAFSVPKNSGCEGTTSGAAACNSVKIVVKKLVNSSELCVDKTAALGVGVKASQSGEEEHVNKVNTPKNSVECLKALESSTQCLAMKAKSMASVDGTQVVMAATSNSDSTVSQQQSANSKSPRALRSAPRPQVPARDPKTALTTTTTTPNNNNQSPPIPVKREFESPLDTNKLTNSTPAHPNNNRNSHVAAHDDDDIYQPIWKFKTVGEVLERYQTDADYYDLNSIQSKTAVDDSSFTPTILNANDVEDHGEWETDDEFMFTTQLDCEVVTNAAETCSLNSSTVRSTHSTSSNTGSTVTGFNSSTATLASALGVSLRHHLFTNIGIFYSPTEPKLRAIIYDNYDRILSSAYFTAGRGMSLVQNVMAHSQESVNSVADKSSPPPPTRKERSPVPPPRTTSAAASDRGGWQQQAKAPKPTLLPDSVQAWKFQLLDVNYLEDEEDMIVSENEILRAQEIKEDIDTRQMPQKNIMNCYKSVSFGNLIDLPSEDDKKSIAERMRNKLQRGVFKLNVRSPKSEKKSRGIFRRAEATSLYLEDGMKPKYPIFGAPLDQLELNTTAHPNVPRFVVDCVKIIERKDCILQDGLYRASGNKVYIDELKQKLSESYIYDPKLLVADDIHTLTSLLKLFFRELGAPLIPQETYERLGRNLSDPATIDGMRQAFEDMREPNRSTLQFLIKHLTNVAACSSENRMPASNLAIVWGPCLLSANQIEFDIGRMNTLAKVLIENYERIFNENERLVC